MKRQFLRIYLGIAVVLFLAAAATLLVANRTLGNIHRENFRLRAVAQATTIRDVVAEATEPQTRERILKALQTTRRLRFELTALSDLSLNIGQRQRLLAGETLGFDDEDGLRTVSLLPEGRVLDATFLPRPRPLPPDFLFLAVLAGALLLVGVVFYLLVRPVERRIGALSSAAERLGTGDLAARATVAGDDAISELAATFNAMAGQLGRLVEGQKELLRAVSHELRTPLARLFFLLDDAQETNSAEEKDRILSRIQGSLTDLNDIVEELLTFVRLDGDAAAPAPEQIDLRSVFEEMRRIVGDLRREVTVEIDWQPAKLEAISRYFRRAILNLVTNAARHARSAVRIACIAEGGGVRISVEDDGPGVPELDRGRIFEPFYRIDESRNSDIGGTGLGLAIVRRIVQYHGGQAEVGAGGLGGARFTLIFPSTFHPSSDSIPSVTAP
jgi:signal transduction histidine kinase